MKLKIYPDSHRLASSRYWLAKTSGTFCTHYTFSTHRENVFSRTDIRVMKTPSQVLTRRKDITNEPMLGET